MLHHSALWLLLLQAEASLMRKKIDEETEAWEGERPHEITKRISGHRARRAVLQPPGKALDLGALEEPQVLHL